MARRRPEIPTLEARHPGLRRSTGRLLAFHGELCGGRLRRTGLDPDIIQALAAALSLMIPVLGLSIVGAVVLGRSRLGDALARHIAGGRYDPEIDEPIAALQEEVAMVRHQLQETQERVEFTERQMSRADRPEPLPRPAPTYSR